MKGGDRMSKVVKKLMFETSLMEYGQVNSGFARVKILIMTHEQIANGTRFSKEVIDRRRSGLNYLPVVGEFKEEDFGTHGGKLEITDDDYKFIDTTRPYGVVMADTARWENVVMKNGDTIEYLVADAYLWIERYPELNVLYDGKLNNQSMEIDILDGEFNEDSWVYDVKDFEYSALCILGKHVEPAFSEARVDVNFNKDCFKDKYREMMFALDKYLENYEQSGVGSLAETKNMEVDEVVEDKFEEESVDVVEDEKVEDDVTEEEFQEQDDTIEDVDKKEDSVEEIEDQDTTNEENDESTDEKIEEIDYKEKYETLMTEFEKLQDDLAELKEYRANIELEEKTSTIETFKHRYSLSDDDIKDVVENIHTYSKEQVEEKLCTIVVKTESTTNYSKDKAKTFKSAILNNYDNSESGTAGVKAILRRRSRQQ